MLQSTTQGETLDLLQCGAGIFSCELIMIIDVIISSNIDVFTKEAFALLS